MRFLMNLFKVLLLSIGFLVIIGGTLGSLCGIVILDAGVTIGGALVALAGVGLYMGANRALDTTRAEAAEDYAEMVMRQEAARATGGNDEASPDKTDGNVR
uniref:Transmembrane protein n=1 Tax=Dechloromonas aromatica (strain RCB) TaxID=159087 RepID=Q47J18_DECAR